MLIIVMIISIAPSGILIASDWEEGLLIHVDDEGYVTFEPNNIEHELVLDSDFIHIRLPMEIDAQAINLSLPEGWTYEIDYAQETFQEGSFAPIRELDGKIYTIVTVQHTWNHFANESRQRDIMPLLSNVPDEFTEVSLPSNASPSDWISALGPAHSRRVIRVSSNQTSMPANVTISGGRQIIIASSGTNLANNTLVGSPFILTRFSGSGRHFVIEGDSSLTLVQIILDGENRRDLLSRGGVYLEGWPGEPRLNMLTGSEIRNCRAELGGGIQAEFFTHVQIDGGTLRNNIAMNNGWGGGGGARIRWSSSLTLRNALIVDNKAIASFGHGGGIEITNLSNLTIREGTIIRRNTAGMRGGGVAIWHDSTGVMHDGQIIDNEAGQSGGGIVLTGVNVVGASADTTNFTMNGGTIEENRAGERGGGISGIHPSDITASTQMGVQKISINGGEIRENTSANGGGVWFHSGTFETSGGKIFENIGVNGAGVYWAEGPGVWRALEGEIDIYDNEASGNGGGIATVGSHNRTIPPRVNIWGNEAQNGGGVWMGGSGILTMNSETIPIRENKATQNGGGVYISTGTFVQSGSSITENDATGDGGGVYVVHGCGFTGTGGSIIDNIANNGGGLYVPHPNLNNVSIAPNFVFDQNFAREGLRIDSDLAQRWRLSIRPDIVSLLDQLIIDEVPEGTGNFMDVDPHAFTNYDINSDKPIFWRVTYDAVGDGDVLAYVDSNKHPIKNAALLREGTALLFEANLAEKFEQWTVETRDKETTEDGKEVDFTLIEVNTVSPLRYSLSAHTHVVGYFRAQPSTTTLTVSKEVNGHLANRIIEFDFSIIFQDSAGNPQSTPEPLPYTITGLDELVLRRGVLTLDNEGRAMFSLSHGQVIHITEVPMDGTVQIIEALDEHYQAWFTDSESEENKEKGHDTGPRPMTEERSFHFENVRFDVPATALKLGSLGWVLLLLTLVSIPAFAMLVFRIERGRH